LISKVEQDKKKNDPTYQTKSYYALEKKLEKVLKKALDEYFGFIKDLDRNDWFSV
jgi:carboxyl-terminal processing protease